eukprot:PITA_31278
MGSRRIRVRQGKDILRWGNSMKGTFTTKEAYYLMDSQNRGDENVEWKTIWEANWWLKVTIFIWLATKNKILTWDRIQKKGFNGPSRCYLCNNDTETRDHLLVRCPYTEKLWLLAKRLFKKPGTNSREFNDLIFNWSKETFGCRVIQRAWNLISPFILWMIWKERNRRIFQNSAKNPEVIWARVVESMRETILISKWANDDRKENLEEQEILNTINLKPEMVHIKRSASHDMRTQSPEEFSYPSDHFVKLNFDGASKGNSGDASFGGIFRDGNRRGWEKVAKSWRTAGIVKEIDVLLKRIDYRIISHVRRKGNQAADWLANWGCSGRGTTIDSQWQAVEGNGEWEALAELIKVDHDKTTNANARISELA